MSNNERTLLIATVLAVCMLVVPDEARGVAHDTDQDGLSDELERVYYTDPLRSDTDQDGYPDGEEVIQGYSPHASSTKMHQFDYDKDGLNDWLERWFRSDIGAADSDKDGKSDYEEVMSAESPTDAHNAKKFDQKIEVDLTRQHLHYFVDRVAVASFPVSTGNPWTPTPPGTFGIDKKIDVKRYVGADYNLPNVKWNLQFKPGYYIHGAYWHNDFGKRTHSHGCVNMRTEDAAVIYKYIDVGVPVVITGRTPPKRVVKL